MPWALDETNMSILDDPQVAETRDDYSSWMTDTERFYEATSDRDRLRPSLLRTEDDDAERYDSLLKWAAQSQVHMYKVRDDLFGMQIEAAVALDNWTMLQPDDETGSDNNTSSPTPSPAVTAEAATGTEPLKTSRVNNRATVD
jgi:hypothetical protein